MTYLTEQEYEEMGFAKIVSPFSFDNLLTKASLMLDVITLNHYQYHDLASDTSFKAKRFKMALATQINHFQELGVTSSDEQDDYASVSIGRTSWTYKDKKTGKVSSVQSDDVMLYLSGTGLLSRGVCR